MMATCLECGYSHSYGFVDDGTIDGVRYVTVVNDRWDPIEYGVPLTPALIAEYGLGAVATKLDDDHVR